MSAVGEGRQCHLRIEPRTSSIASSSRNTRLPPKKTAFFTPQQAAKRSLEDTAGLVTETLARIYEKQGNLPKAIDAYRRLACEIPGEKRLLCGPFKERLKDAIERIEPWSPSPSSSSSFAHLLALVVLAQNPKGGGLAAGFTGAQQIGGVQRTADFLEKGTWTLAGRPDGALPGLRRPAGQRQRQLDDLDTPIERLTRRGVPLMAMQLRTTRRLPLASQLPG